ncbi:hypothetical protein [Paenibacillus daejeonensis]|uniref:hypothetical protein n=1 Tax=Paenibacillus daejeonensis TaxID=135193 RepID=UPI00036FCB07|nr:hypothetical protein [Paenibacillus daejeonensis]
MLILPRGITDFGEPEANENVSDLEFKQFCYDLLVVFDYTKFEEIETYSGNYHLGKLSNKKIQTLVLMNKHYPIIGLADEYRDGNANFIDSHDVALYINAKLRTGNQKSKYNYYQCLNLSVLNKDITDKTIMLLDHSELEQLKYWNPIKYKDVIFNCWD